MNSEGWSIYWDDLRKSWVLTDTPNISYQYKETLTWSALLKALDSSIGVNEFDILTHDNLTRIFDLYEVVDNSLIEPWKSKVQNVYPKNKLLYIDLIIELESIAPLEINQENIEMLFRLYRLNSLRRIDSSIEERWINGYEQLGSILPILIELNSFSSIYTNSDLLKRTIVDLYRINDGDVMISWYKRLGYEYTLSDVLKDVRPGYFDKINKQNLEILFKILDIKSGEIISKWESRINLGYLICDVYAELSNLIEINFSMSPQTSPDDLPTRFTYGFGTLEDYDIKVTSNNDTIGDNNSLTWGIYRDKTKIIGSQIYVYVNTYDDVDFSDSIIFAYNSIKNAVNGYVYYYNIDNNQSNLVKRIKTNKGKYACKKQFGHSVSLSKDYINVGSPIVGDFNIDSLITFGGKIRNIVWGNGQNVFRIRRYTPATYK